MNEFIIKNGLIAKGNSTISGSLIVTEGITGSLQGTASYATNAGTSIDTGSLVTTASFNAFTASYGTGSFTGSFTGTLQGTASWAQNAVTASYITASNVFGPYGANSITSASYAANALSASYAPFALTASYSQTASYVSPLNQQIILSGSFKLDPTQDPDPTGIDLDSTVFFQSSSNTALGYDLYVRQNGNLVKWKWIEGILETGLLYGGAVTYSGSNVFVSPGSGIIADHNATTGSEVSPMIEYVTWNAVTQSITNIATQQVTYIYIDNTGTLQQQSTRFTSQQYHDYIPLGAVGHFDYTQVSAFGGGVQTAYDQISQISNFIDAFGPLKMSGYGLTGQAGSLRLSVGAGTSFIHGGFYQNNPEFPSQITTPSQATASLARVQRSGSVITFDTNGGNLYTVVDPTQYDRDGDGVLHSVGSGNWSIQRVFTDPKTGVLYVYYGQARYTSLLNALQYLPTDPFTEGDTFDFTTFVGFLVLKGNASNITDTANNSILNGGLFRGSGQGSGGGIALSNLDDLTDVSIVSPTNGQALVYNSGIWQNGTPSLATTASYVLNAVSASYATQALSASWAPGGPGGSDTYIQFNNVGAFGGEQYFTYSSISRSIAQGNTNSVSGLYSHAEGEFTTTYGNTSHTEGYSTKTGITTAYTADNITAGLVKLNTSYGDQTTVFYQGSSLMYGSAAGLVNYNLLISGSYWDTVNTYIQLLDIAIDTAATPTTIAVQYDYYYNHISNNAGDQLLTGNNAHAEGGSTIAIGLYAHAEGESTEAHAEASHAEGYSTAAISAFSHAEGNGTTAIGQSSHAEGESTIAIGFGSHTEGSSTTTGIFCHGLNTPIISGVFELALKYGDITSQFIPGNFVLINDGTGEITGVPTTHKFEIASVTYNATPATEISLVDISVNTVTSKPLIGQYQIVAPLYANNPIGDYSHAAGEGTQTYGYASTAAGKGTEALGFYQSVVGQYNIPINDTGSFIIGDGDGATRHNLLVAGSGVVQISGSLQVSGSITGSLHGTASFATSTSTSSYANFAETASYVTTAETASYVTTAQTASYVLNAVSASFTSTASYINGSINKNNVVANTSFTGTPLIATITYTTAFPNTNYSIVITGEDARTWTIDSKTAAGFVINSNSSTAITGNTYWNAASYGEFNG